MYSFIDTNEISAGVLLPAEALKINGEFIETLIEGYRTLSVEGREALSPELTTYETGVRDGAGLLNKRYPARTIIIKYQLICKTSEEFRAAYNKLASILNVEEAELIFNDEQDKYFIGTPSNIGSVEPGKNAVIGEFEILCTDPFKYSVIEYEATPILDENSVLINYNGTYKAFPTLEAEFYSENESETDLTGNGDCGYVAFFNENEKIIQLGDPDETDTESYDKSQTLVNQAFQKEIDWGTKAQTNWATNSGEVVDYKQTGNVYMGVASYLYTIAPSTSGTLLSKTSKTAKPYVDYTVTAKTSDRAADRIKVNVTVNSVLTEATNSGAVSIASGAQITLDKTNLYSSSTASSSSGKKTGTYYLWDSSVKNGRIRITNTTSNVGKSGKVTGWVNVADINVTNANVFGSGYGLKGAVQIGGEWHNITLKDESENWNDNSSHTAAITVTVKNIEADTTILEDIKFKVDRTDDNESKAGILEETACNDLEISTYTAPVPESWYLTPESYGNDAGWHGASITRTIPADAAGVVGAKNFTFSYSQKMSIGNGSAAMQELGAFQALLVSGSGTNRTVIAGVNIFKTKSDKTANLRFYYNGKFETIEIDLSHNNKYFGNNTSAIKTSTITKEGSKLTFNIGGIQKVFNCGSSFADVAVNEITFLFAKCGTKPQLSYNGLYWAKLVKNNCDTWVDIPNKFSTNDVVIADCKSGDILLNGSPMAALGALGNDWESFYLKPSLNQVGFSYSDWVTAGYAPKFKVRYREVFI